MYFDCTSSSRVAMCCSFHCSGTVQPIYVGTHRIRMLMESRKRLLTTRGHKVCGGRVGRPGRRCFLGCAYWLLLLATYPRRARLDAVEDLFS